MSAVCLPERKENAFHDDSVIFCALAHGDCVSVTVKFHNGDIQAVSMWRRSRLQDFTSTYGPAVESIHGLKASWPIPARCEVGLQRS